MGVRYPTVAIIFLIVLSNCKKDAQGPTPLELICRGGWKINNAQLAGSGRQVLTDSCVRDNFFGLSPTDGRLPFGSLDQGPTKCDSSDLQNTYLRWNMNRDGTMFSTSIFLFPGNTSMEYHIMDLTEDRLVISTEMLDGGINQNVTITYTH